MGLLFALPITRAVHAEVVPSMNNSSFVLGVERFVSRRGTLDIIWSDNCTNFIGAEKEHHECTEKRNVRHIAAELAHEGYKWKFNQPNALQQDGIEARGWPVVLKEKSRPSSVHVASQIRFEHLFWSSRIRTERTSVKARKRRPVRSRCSYNQSCFFW